MTFIKLTIYDVEFSSSAYVQVEHIRYFESIDDVTFVFLSQWSIAVKESPEQILDLITKELR